MFTQIRPTSAVALPGRGRTFARRPRRGRGDRSPSPVGANPVFALVGRHAMLARPLFQAATAMRTSPLLVLTNPCPPDRSWRHLARTSPTHPAREAGFGLRWLATAFRDTHRPIRSSERHQTHAAREGQANAPFPLAQNWARGRAPFPKQKK